MFTGIKPTAGGLNNSLRSGKLDRNRVSCVSMGSSKMIDEVGSICFSSFFRGAGKSTVKDGETEIYGTINHTHAGEITPQRAGCCVLQT